MLFVLIEKSFSFVTCNYCNCNRFIVKRFFYFLFFQNKFCFLLYAYKRSCFLFCFWPYKYSHIFEKIKFFFNFIWKCCEYIYSKGIFLSYIIYVLIYIFIYIYIYMLFLGVSIENSYKIYPWRGWTHNIFICFQNILLYENEKNLFFQKFSTIFFLLLEIFYAFFLLL